MEALEGHFGIHFGGSWLEQLWNFVVFWVKKCINFANGMHILNQGTNGAHTFEQFCPRFPFPHCSGYGKRECAIPLGRRKPIRGSLRGGLRIRLHIGFFRQKIGKYRKQFKKIRKGSAHLLAGVFIHRIFTDFLGFCMCFEGVSGGNFN